MNTPTAPTVPTVPTVSALIAEDEPLLAQALTSELARAWPELTIVATVGDGASAVKRVLELKPRVLFFDIRMPGLSGLDAAAQLADDWPAGEPFPALVFVTAYDQYAIQAFEREAVDYLLKPVQAQRLAQTVQRVQQRLRAQEPAEPQLMAQLRSLLAGGVAAPAQPPAASLAPLRAIQASVGTSIRMVPLAEVLCFEAADKYVRVLTAAHEYLIRTPLKELAAQLDPAEFWQVHRGVLVRADAIEQVTRDESGKQWLSVRGLRERLPLSRLYAHLFRAM